MPTMKSAPAAAPGTIQVAEIQRPAPGPRDLLVRVRACGICGTDTAFVQMGGMPLGPDGTTASTTLGHRSYLDAGPDGGIGGLAMRRPGNAVGYPGGVLWPPDSCWSSSPPPGSPRSRRLSAQARSQPSWNQRPNSWPP